MRYVLLSLAMALPLAAHNIEEANEEARERLQTATAVLHEVMSVPEQAIPTSLIQRAECAVVIPGLKEGAFVVGAQYGKGYITCRRPGTQIWSAPATVRIEGGSVGFQIGGSSSDVVLLVMNANGRRSIMRSQFTLGGDAKATAGPVGREATAQTDAFLGASILSWARSRGLFAGVSLTGATLRQDLDENEALYGERLTTKQIVEGDVKMPPAARQFTLAVARYAGGGVGERAREQ